MVIQFNQLISALLSGVINKVGLQLLTKVEKINQTNDLIIVVSGFGLTQSPQRCKERNPDSYRDAAASQRTPREILKTRALNNYLVAMGRSISTLPNLFYPSRSRSQPGEAQLLSRPFLF